MFFLFSGTVGRGSDCRIEEIKSHVGGIQRHSRQNEEIEGRSQEEKQMKCGVGWLVPSRHVPSECHQRLFRGFPFKISFFSNFLVESSTHDVHLYL